MNSYIYALSDPISGEVRYVGKSFDPEGRLDGHIKDCRRGNTYSARWIRSLINRGLTPNLNILEKVPGLDSWEAREIFWIATLRKAGCRLTNLTDGGEGLKKGFKNRPEVLYRWVEAARIRKPMTPEHRANIAASKIEKLRPEYMKDAIRRKLVGRKLSPEHRAKVVAALDKNRSWSEERKAKWGRQLSDKYKDAGFREKMSKAISRASLGKPWTEAQRVAGMAWRVRKKAERAFVQDVEGRAGIA